MLGAGSGVGSVIDACSIQCGGGKADLSLNENERLKALVSKTTYLLDQVR
jgi:hypothetical protein